MGLFGQGHYKDSDGKRHRVKDIPDFGTRGERSAPRIESGEAAAVDSRIARRNHQKAMAEQKRKEVEAKQTEAARQRAKKAQAEEKYREKERKAEAKRRKREGK